MWRAWRMQNTSMRTMNTRMRTTTATGWRSSTTSIWTSPVNAMAIVRIINQTLDEALPGEAGRFDRNTRAYLGELEELDGEFRQVVAQGKRHMIIVADKFPFRYFADEYGLSYRAAFSGCAAATRAQRQNHRLPDRQDQGGADSGGLLSGTVQPQHRQE